MFLQILNHATPFHQNSLARELLLHLQKALAVSVLRGFNTEKLMLIHPRKRAFNQLTWGHVRVQTGPEVGIHKCVQDAEQTPSVR